MKQFSKDELAEISRRQIAFAEHSEAPGEVTPFSKLVKLENEIAQELNGAKLKSNGQG
ncbi:hypothetical protein [Yoonia sp. BS5-3]|uniref:Uncharacterized protein n=1 Tax=Yoonia phaeophyticola TaxID=3137369 RepID=A0ABZ2VA42_9RHOB